VNTAETAPATVKRGLKTSVSLYTFMRALCWSITGLYTKVLNSLLTIAYMTGPTERLAVAANLVP